MAQLSCQNLTLGYEGKEILSNLSFEVNSGDYLCIVGENGSGKSTLMKTVLGLKKPMSGKVITGDGLLQTEIGYLPQQTVVQKDFPASVREIVISGNQGRCGLRPFYTKQEKQRAAENIRRMGIEDLQNRCYRELSGGQQQRVLLARALCATQKMLLLDEPVAGLDLSRIDDNPALKAHLDAVGDVLLEGLEVLVIHEGSVDGGDAGRSAGDAYGKPGVELLLGLVGQGDSHVLAVVDGAEDCVDVSLAGEAAFSGVEDALGGLEEHGDLDGAYGDASSHLKLFQLLDQRRLACAQKA